MNNSAERHNATILEPLAQMFASPDELDATLNRLIAVLLVRRQRLSGGAAAQYLEISVEELMSDAFRYGIDLRGPAEFQVPWSWVE